MSLFNFLWYKKCWFIFSLNLIFGFEEFQRNIYVHVYLFWHIWTITITVVLFFGYTSRQCNKELIAWPKSTGKWEIFCWLFITCTSCAMKILIYPLWKLSWSSDWALGAHSVYSELELLFCDCEYGHDMFRWKLIECGIKQQSNTVIKVLMTFLSFLKGLLSIEYAENLLN